MLDMRLDHLSYAAGPDGLANTARRIGSLLGEQFTDGGIHPRFGTRNMILALTAGTYLEVVGVLDHPASDKAPFGQAVRARSALGGGWLGWVVSVDDIAKVEYRLGRASVPGNRHRPDGVELKWRQIGVKGLQSDPQLPFFVEWQCLPGQHPSADASGRVRLDTIEIAGDPNRVSEWLGNNVDGTVEDVNVEWVAPHGTPGVVAAHFSTPRGSVRI
jgi:Glyoxalase-like domain